MPSSSFELIPFDEAIPRLGLAAHFGEHAFDHFGEEGGSVRYYADDAHIDGDVDLDKMFYSDNVAGIFAARDLTISGSVLNWEIDTTASFLAVGRDLACHNVIAGSADIRVRRDLKAENIVVSTYNHGYLEVSRDVHARYLIIDDHTTIVGGKVHGLGWKDAEFVDVPLTVSNWRQELLPAVKDEFIDDQGDVKCPNGNVDIVKALLAGRQILRS
jgi:hypothetical protein